MKCWRLHVPFPWYVCVLCLFFSISIRAIWQYLELRTDKRSSDSHWHALEYQMSSLHDNFYFFGFARKSLSHKSSGSSIVSRKSLAEKISKWCIPTVFASNDFQAALNGSEKSYFRIRKLIFSWKLQNHLASPRIGTATQPIFLFKFFFFRQFFMWVFNIFFISIVCVVEFSQ